MLPAFCISDNKLPELPNDRIDVMASLITLNISFNRVKAIPTDMPYLYRMRVWKYKLQKVSLFLCSFDVKQRNIFHIIYCLY